MTADNEVLAEPMSDDELCTDCRLRPVVACCGEHRFCRECRVIENTGLAIGLLGLDLNVSDEGLAQEMLATLSRCTVQGMLIFAASVIQNTAWQEHAADGGLSVEQQLARLHGVHAGWVSSAGSHWCC